MKKYSADFRGMTDNEIIDELKKVDTLSILSTKMPVSFMDAELLAYLAGMRVVRKWDEDLAKAYKFNEIWVFSTR